jgi:malate/lactate dehydrogenase
MGVMSDGSYGVPRGINFSFPVICRNGTWSIVQGLDLSDSFSQEKFQNTLDELIREKKIAMDFLTSQ